MNRLFVLLLAGVLGYLTLFLVFPKVDLSAKWKLQFDRQQAIAKARQFALENGFEISGRSAFVNAEYYRRNEYLLAHEPDPPAARLLSPVNVVVRLLSPDPNRAYRVTINPSGEIIGFRQVNRWAGNRDHDPDINRQSPAQNQSGNQNSSSTESEKKTGLPVSPADRLIAEEFLQKLTGNQLNTFSLSDATSTTQGAKFVWTNVGKQVKHTLEAIVKDGKIARFSIDPTYTPQFQKEYDERRTWWDKLLSNADNVVIFPTIILAIIFYFIGLALKRVQHRPTLIFFGLVFLLVLFSSYIGIFADSVLGDLNINPAPTNRLVMGIILWTVFILLCAGVSVFVYFCWAAGQALAIQLEDRKTASLELMLRGEILTQSVMKSLFIGLTIGGILSAIPYLVAGSGLFKAIEMDPQGFEDLMLSRAPAVASFTNTSQLTIFGVFAFLFPLTLVFVRPRRLAKAICLILAFLSVMDFCNVYLPASGFLLVGGLIAVLVTAVYFRSGLLAVITACFAAQTAIGAASLLAQPAASLRTSGWIAIVGLGIITAVALVAQKFVREVKEEEIAVPPGLLVTRAERDRLKAEFDVARRAQQQMLPDATPQIEGFEIAAICRPSREVGGDLYDFIYLPGGRLGVVVADVSGKGVPASLYMTLTKGLLDSVSESKDDPGDILREINHHLYEVCQKKVFVTLFLGVLDPVRKTLIYARAGHNPPVLYRPVEQTTKLLKPPGMGLGLGSSKIFDGKLKVESLQLQSNDILFFYSDGITEAMNSKNEEYGEERLIKVATSLNGAHADQALRMAMSDVERFLGPVPPQDDQTLVVIRVK